MPGEIGRFIYTILSADATLQSALGVSSSTAANKKVYPNFAPQNETAPYIVYERSDTQPIHCKEGLPIVDHYYTVSCFAENPDTLETIAERVIFLLDNAAGTYGTTVITGCLYDSDRDETYDLEPILFSRDIEFQIREKR
jgi:hypothetical protein